MAEITVVKIGGNVVDNPEALARFVRDFASMPGQKVLVHGGGKEATRLSAKMGIETQMVEGRRITDRDTLDIVTMVYAGLVNKRIVSMLQAAGCNAIGLSGADGNAICATKRPANPIDYGFVGDIATDGVNAMLLAMLMREGMVPVLCAIQHDGAGTLLNCNADSVASAVAIALSAIEPTRLVYCFEKKGVLRDVDDDNSVIAEITPRNYPQLRSEGIISKGMIPKIDNALASIAKGVESVSIRRADDLLTNSGTNIRVHPTKNVKARSCGFLR